MEQNGKNMSEATPSVERQAGDPVIPDTDGNVEEWTEMLREKILFSLAVYPFVSPSMLHVAMGTSTPKSVWKDVVLAKLIEEGEVLRTEVTLTSPHERSQTYTVLHLRAHPYHPPQTQQNPQTA